MRDAVERLIGRLERSKTWPPKFEKAIRHDVAGWAAFRDSDATELKRLASWPADRQYVIDNLPEKIPTAYANLLYGEDPRITPADDADEDQLADLTDDLTSALRSAVETAVSEGEVWWRISADRTAGHHPQITFHSRCDVVPLLSGRHVVAVAFVSFLDHPDGGEVADATNPGRAAWRHLEIHSEGSVENFLYRGSWTQLGDQAGLAEHPETKDLPEIWSHDLPMLAGRIVFRYGRRPHVGRSIYQGVWTRFLVLNEATTVGRENMRLTAKKRAVISAAALRTQDTGPPGSDLPLANGPDGTDRPRAPRFDAGEDILLHDPLDVEEGRESSPYRILEYSFDAEALIAYLKFEAETICQRCDVVPQFIGSGDFGLGASGIALRVRLLPTTNAAQGIARAWDASLPEIVRRAQLVDALAGDREGFGVPWTKPSEPPVIKRTNPLPEDPNEVGTRLSLLKTAGLMSAKEGLRELHPEWDDDRVDEEVAAIRSDAESTVPRMPFGDQ